MATTKAGSRAANKYTRQTYDRLAIFTDRETGARLRAAAEVAGESINSFIINGAVSRIQGGAAAKVQLADVDGINQLIADYENSLAAWQHAAQIEHNAKQDLDKRTADLLTVLKNSI